MNKNFVHLHLHTEYSLLDGVGKIEEYVDRARQLNMSAIAITDHGNMFGAIEFYKSAISKGIKPIIGLEAYVSEFGMDQKEGRNFHIVLLAKNENGYKNLLKIASEGFLKGFYYRPRIDKTFLKEHSDGIIALSACMQGEISRAILDREPEDKVESKIMEYVKIFGKENFYLEVQGNEIEEQKELNNHLFNYSKKTGVRCVATNDTHYVYKGDHVLQDLVICIQTGSKVSDANRMKIDSKELFLKSREEMIDSLGEKYIEAINQTEEIANRCNLKLEFGELKFPKYEIPSCSKNAKDFLRKIVYKGLSERYPSGLNEELLKRVEYELDVILKMGYEEYFIVVWDFISYAKGKNIPIGPGRGSAAGSLVAYALKITDLDPIKYNLIFERFLNPERISMPDIDIDICQERRGEVIDYVTKKYGEDKVAQIITFGRMKARAALRDVGRVLDINLAKVDKVAKLIPTFTTLEGALKESLELREIYSEDKEIRNLIDLSQRLENKVRHASIHAAGVVITKEPLTDIVPLYSDNKDKIISTQYQMKELEELGLLKMDFLGLRNLTNIQRTIDYIKETKGKNIKLEEIPLDEKDVYKMLSKGDSLGVFQLESTGIRKILVQLKPNKFEDLIALLALYRPGPLGSGMVESFINCKNGVEEIKYPHPSLEKILKETYGVILYQEQVMKIANIMANYSLGEADLLRRAMGKKQATIMLENRDKFIERATKNDYSKEKAEEIFDLIDKFAGYGFNKSHSAAYAMIAYWTAYFKFLYPEEYYASIMTSEKSNVENVAFYIEDAKNHKMKLMLSDVNNPVSKFTVENGGIRFSLAAIKNVGESLAEKIKIEFDNNGQYMRFEDFIYRLRAQGLNKKNIEALIYSGALDSVPGNRKQKVESIEKAIDYANKKIKEDDIQQMNLFGGAKSEIVNFSFPETTDFSMDEKLEKEKEYLGFYYSAHPLDKYRWLITTYKMDRISEIKNENSQHSIKTYGILRDVKKILTKKTGEAMSTFILEDYYDQISGIIFPREYKEFINQELEGKAVFIEGTIQVDYFNGNENKKIVVRKLIPISELEFGKKNKLYILIKDSSKEKYNRLKELLLNNTGDVFLSFAIDINGEKEIKNSKIKVRVSQYLIKEIEELLGEGSVIIK
ncbi:DNA polymerase III subunit alpha [Cetobacterium sp. 8H]|uniref:DNA polymerase III subunit alpha n=1 Tax=Cetobacterium sp. 8H TaxID=2759681 RepID=UPI00163CCB64|nr:DNA polymerase III subunit alpha [Cetobacterium sp. 8H]MBC2851383.1 DNA polymerase III subunit alpha [Cetobacterium sp. 8H]